MPRAPFHSPALWLAFQTQRARGEGCKILTNTMYCEDELFTTPVLLDCSIQHFPLRIFVFYYRLTLTL